MIQGTTPTYICTLPNTVDLTAADHVMFTISQGSVVIDKSDADLTITAHTVAAYLSQVDSLRFQQYSKAKVQVNWTYSDGSRACSEVVEVEVGENLHQEVIS